VVDPPQRVLPAEFGRRLVTEWQGRGEAVRQALECGSPVVSLRLNQKKLRDGIPPLPPEWLVDAIPWCEGGYFLPQRPSFTLDPLMHAGVYYVQEASSQILDAVLSQLGPIRLGLDLCAAPGGKSQIIGKHLQAGGHLMCNEVSRTRVASLEETLAKWGNPRMSVWNAEPRDFVNAAFRFDCILVDAPCSGEGLFRRETQAVERWKPELAETCMRTQRKILDEIMPCLGDNGILIYSTCTLSRLENEDQWHYLVKCGLVPVPLPFPQAWGWADSADLYSDMPAGHAFRMLPDQGLGEPFFLVCFRKPGHANTSPVGGEPERTGVEWESNPRLPLAVGLPADTRLLVNKNQCYVVSDWVFHHFDAKRWKKCLKPGTRFSGGNGPGASVPPHELALLAECGWNETPSIELDEREALWYLSGKEFDPGGMPKGFFLVRHRGFPLGWGYPKGRSLSRSYPAPWRIRMVNRQSPNRSGPESADAPGAPGG